MIEFGKTLQGAREAAGLTVAQLAEKTHMPPSRITQLEAEDFSKIPAAIYGRGFVRLYCEAVGLDPKPLSDEFTEIFNGRREPEIRERAPEPVPVPSEREDLAQTREATEAEAIADVPPPKMKALTRSTEATEPEPISARREGLTRSHGVTEAEKTYSDDLFAEPSRTPAPAKTSASPSLRVSNSPVHAPEESASEAHAAEPPTPAAERGPALSRYAAPVREPARLSLPPSVWRFAVLGGAAIVVLWLAFLGVRALYRATGGTPTDVVEEPSSASSAAVAPAVPAGTAAPRTQQKIPELYID